MMFALFALTAGCIDKHQRSLVATTDASGSTLSVINFLVGWLLVVDFVIQGKLVV